MSVHDYLITPKLMSLKYQKGIKIASYLGFCLVLGACAGVIWAGLVELPAYQILIDSSASISERTVIHAVDADIWFVLGGLIFGLSLGIIAWVWFQDSISVLSVVTASGAFISAITCWLLGRIFGPSSFIERLAAARPGDDVPINLDIHSVAVLFVWPFFALIPIIIASAVGVSKLMVQERREKEARSLAALIEINEAVAETVELEVPESIVEADSPH